MAAVPDRLLQAAAGWSYPASLCPHTVSRVQPAAKGQSEGQGEGEGAGDAPQHPTPLHSGTEHESCQVYCLSGHCALRPPGGDLSG